MVASAATAIHRLALKFDEKKKKEEKRMLLFKKGMLYTKDVRFALPDGFYIQVDGIFYDSGISAWSLDRREHIIWQTTDSSVGVEEG